MFQEFVLNLRKAFIQICISGIILVLLRISFLYQITIKNLERHTDIFEREVTIMKKINCISEEQEFEGFPRLVQHGVLPNNKNYMIMSYNGNESTSLKQIFKSISGYNTILNLGQEVIKSLKVLHSLGLVHCDVKPSNILYTKNSDNPEKFTLIDFGISRRYLDQKNKHVLKQRLVNFSGSIEFIATDCLKKYHPTRKHDLEALLNTMIYLFTSQCSFGELNNSFASTKIRVIHQLENREKAIRIASKHRDSLATFLTKNIEINSCFTEFAEIILNMEYDEEPQYEALINLLEKCKESEVKVETACESSANQSKSSSLSQFLEFIRFSNKDEFSKSNKNSESKSDSAINNDDPNIVKKKSFFSKKEIDNENYSQSSEDSCNSYYTCKSSEEVINRSNMEDLVCMDPCEPQSCKQIYHLHGKLFVQDRVWDDIDVNSFEEHKSTPCISIPESVVNYR